MILHEDAVSLTCKLEHPVFSKLENVVFRLSSADGMPMMALGMDGREFLLPLPAVQREFGIADDSPDGRMLKRVVAALGFVATLRPNHPFPAEVVTGEASWQFSPAHLRIASARLRLWVAASAGFGVEARDVATTGATLIARAEEPAFGPKLDEAYARVAATLDLPGPATVSDMLGDLTKEFAYIEAMRDRMFRRLRSMSTATSEAGRHWCAGVEQRERLAHVQRLTERAVRTVGQYFSELDDQTSDMLDVLRNVEAWRTLVRFRRDRLYRSLRTWEPVLAEWESLGSVTHIGSILERTQRFLAPRFMAFSDAYEDRGPEEAIPLHTVAW